ncbi:TPA: hypothetical protein ACH3X1_007790 [Trebouxia sp. C0004]
MADVYNMKKVFSCTDFLSDLWQGGPDGDETLGGLPCPASDEGGSTQLGQEGSTDILHMLNQAEEADLNSRKLANLTASSSNKQESGGQHLARDPVDSTLLHSSLSASGSLLSHTFYPQPASTNFSHFETSPAQLPPVPSTSLGQGVFHMDPVKQAKAICNHGVSGTALQQQLAELKGKACGLESMLRSGVPTRASPCFPELAPINPCTSGISGSLDALTQAAAPQMPVAAPAQSQLGLQDYQLRQLASLLGSANMAALQSMPLPPAAPHNMPDNSARVLSQQPASSARCTDHSSGDDNTGAIPELHKLSSLGDSPMDDGEHSWEATLDKNLAPPEMKRMRRMLSNRESARRSRRRKQAHMQDLEVQNNELVEANEMLQKEMSMLRGLAKEAILEKKKSQAALEALKHQVVHMLGEHTRVAKQGTLKQGPAAQPSTAGSDSNASGSGQLAFAAPSSTSDASPKTGSGHLAVMAPTITGEASFSEAACNSPQGSSPKPKPVSHKLTTFLKASLSPKSGSKRKASDI